MTAPPPLPGNPASARRQLLASLCLGGLICLMLTGCGPGGNSGKPLLDRPTLREDQEAMPELGAFDAETPAQSPGLGSPLGAPAAPPLGQGALLGQ